MERIENLFNTLCQRVKEVSENKGKLPDDLQEDAKVIHILENILSILHYKTRFVMDEFEELTNPLHEVKFNIGLGQPLDPLRWEVPKAIVKAWNNRSENWKENFAKSYGKELLLNEKDIKQFQEFIALNSDVLSVDEKLHWSQWLQSLSEPIRKRVLLANAHLMSYFAHAVGARTDVDHGLAPNRADKTEEVVPFDSNMNPSPLSSFSHKDILINRILLVYLEKGLLPNQLQQLVTLWKGLAETSQFSQIPSEVLAYAEASNTSIKDWKSENSHSLAQLHNDLGHIQSVIIQYLEIILFPSMRIQMKLLNSTSNDITLTIASEVYGMSGTPNFELLPYNIVAQPDMKTNLDFLELLLNPNVVKIEVVPDGELEANVGDSHSGIADPLAYYAGRSREDVARSWMKKLPQSFKKVIFFASNTDKLSVLNRNGTISTAEEIQASRDTFTIYDLLFN